MSQNHPAFLLENESIIIETKKNPVPLVLRLITSLIILALFILLPTIVSAFAPNFLRGSELFATLVCGAFGLLVFLLRFLPLLFHYLTDYACITKKRIYGKMGLLHTSELDIPLDKVQSVSIDRTLCGKIFNYATLVIKSVGAGWSFPIISNAEEFHKAFYAHQSPEKSTSDNSDDSHNHDHPDNSHQ